MHKNAFRKPLPKQKPAPKSKTSSQISSPSDGDDSMEGKLLDEIEYGTAGQTKTKKSIETKGSGTAAKAAADKKKPSRPSLLPELSLADEIQVASETNDGKESPKKKTSVRRVGSFDVDPAKTKAPSKPQVVYKNRKLSNGGNKPKAKQTTKLGSDDESDEDQPDQSSDSEKGATARKSPIRTPVVELEKKRKLASSPAASPKAKSRKVSSSTSNDEPEAKPKKGVNTTRPSSSDQEDDDELLLAPSAGQIPATPVAVPNESQRSARSAKTASSKRLSELAAYNIDAVEAEEGGSAGVLLDALALDLDSDQDLDISTGSHGEAVLLDSQNDDTKIDVDEPNPNSRPPTKQTVRPTNTSDEVSEASGGMSTKQAVRQTKTKVSESAETDIDKTASRRSIDQVSASEGDGNVKKQKGSEPSSSPVTSVKAKGQATTKPSSPALEGGSARVKKSVPAPTVKPKPKESQTKQLTTATSKAKPKPPVATANRLKKAEPNGDTSSTPELESDHLAFDKHLILRVIVAKLESSRTCDWYELSAQLNKEGVGAGLAKKVKKSDAAKITGDQLYELYHNIVLPALKAGKALWKDDVSSVPSPESEAIVTPQLEEVALPDDLESEEEEMIPASTKSRSTKAK